ncbi:carbonic anhydrase family protein [Burkholderia cepacia]|uniref:Carbonic anhydrase n=1 Tax=Burkholderia cepacia TaxID=292 RepID=A0AA88YY82_BURCE|nr:carbonic anhydrase family protein [Burkholderia cepacia]KGB93030.1 eukaryotic-type carbonic anhydrase family protein [Burkholderia cepacia]
MNVIRTAITRLVTATLCAVTAPMLPAHAADASAPASAAPADHAFDYDHQRDWHLESGDAQSPVAIDASTARQATRYADENNAIGMHIADTRAKAIDNGHTIQIVPAVGSATIRGRHFTLQQIHFHSPSEHTIDGRNYPIEGHFVFRAQDGRLAVVAVLYRTGAENAQFAAAMDALKAGDTASLSSFRAAALMPGNMNIYYHYLGSLTTPPLTENVEWYVLDEPVELSAEDITAFRMRYSHNARVVQPLNGRPLLRYDAR